MHLRRDAARGGDPSGWRDPYSDLEPWRGREDQPCRIWVSSTDRVGSTP